MKKNRNEYRKSQQLSHRRKSKVTNTKNNRIPWKSERGKHTKHTKSTTKKHKNNRNRHAATRLGRENKSRFRINKRPGPTDNRIRRRRTIVMSSNPFSLELFRVRARVEVLTFVSRLVSSSSKPFSNGIRSCPQFYFKVRILDEWERASEREREREREVKCRTQKQMRPRKPYANLYQRATTVG